MDAPIHDLGLDGVLRPPSGFQTQKQDSNVSDIVGFHLSLQRPSSGTAGLWRPTCQPRRLTAVAWSVWLGGSCLITISLWIQMRHFIGGTILLNNIRCFFRSSQLAPIVAVGHSKHKAPI